MSTRTLFHVFEFDPSLRDLYVMSDSSKLTVIHGWASLREDWDTGLYPTDDEISIRTRIYNPNAVKAWRGIMPVVSNKVVLDSPLTSTKFRLFDGTDELYWDGGAWAVAGVGDWSDMADLQTNLGAFSSSTNELAVVINLKTTDSQYTPRLLRVVVALDVDIKSWIDEYLYKGLLRELKQYVGAVEYDWAVKWPADGDSYDMSEYKPENGLIITDVVAASTNKEHSDSILDSYGPGTKVLTLTGPQSAGTKVFIRVIPDILFAVSTHQDWYQPSRVPAVVFRHYKKRFAGESPAREFVVDYATLEALAQKSPRREDVDIPVDVLADRASVIPTITERIQEYARRHPIVVTPGAGLEARLEVTEDTAFYPRGGEEGIQRGVIRVFLRNCQEWHDAPTDETAVGELQINNDTWGPP